MTYVLAREPGDYPELMRRFVQAAFEVTETTVTELGDDREPAAGLFHLMLQDDQDQVLAAGYLVGYDAERGRAAIDSPFHDQDGNPTAPSGDVTAVDLWRVLLLEVT